MQDEGLDVIAEGLDTLKNMAHDINEVCYIFFFDIRNQETVLVSSFFNLF